MANGLSILHHGLGLSIPLDAHTYNMGQIIRTGNYFFPYPISGASGTAALGADRIFAHPFYVARDMTLDRLAIDITSAGAGSTVARLGIYNNGTNCYPGTLVLDAGTVAADGVAVVAATISQALTRGLYWLVLVSDGTPTLQGWAAAEGCLGIAATSFDTIYTSWYKDTVGAGALDDPFVSGATIFQNFNAFVAPRLLTLD